MKDKYKNDPTNDFETVKEYTKEELFEQYASENDVPEAVTNYIYELANKQSKNRKLIKELLDYAKGLEDKDYLINKLKQLL